MRRPIRRNRGGAVALSMALVLGCLWLSLSAPAAAAPRPRASPYPALAAAVAHAPWAPLAWVQRDLGDPLALGLLRWTAADARRIRHALGPMPARPTVHWRYAETFLVAFLAHNPTAFQRVINDGGSAAENWTTAPAGVSAIDAVARDGRPVAGPPGMVTYPFQATYTTTRGTVATDVIHVVLMRDPAAPRSWILNGVFDETQIAGGDGG